jgi:hypothetical protein
VLVLQSCTDPLYILPSSPDDTFPTSSDCIYDIGNIKVEAGVEVIEDSAIAVNKEADIGIKQVEITGDTSFVGTNAETNMVSYICVCVLLDTFYMTHFFYVSISVQLKRVFCCQFFGGGVELGGG